MRRCLALLALLGASCAFNKTTRTPAAPGGAAAAKKQTWSLEIIDKGGHATPGLVGWRSQGLFDDKGNFHALYFAGNQARYFFRDLESGAASKDRIETLPATINEFARHLSLGKDNNGLYAAAPTAHGLTYFKRFEDGWAVSFIADEINGANPWSLAISSVSEPLLAYKNSAGGISLLAPHRQTGQKQQAPMPSTSGPPLCLAAAFNKQGELLVAFMGLKEQSLGLWVLKQSKIWHVKPPLFKTKAKDVSSCQIVFTADAEPQAAVVLRPEKKSALFLLAVISKKKNKWRLQNLSQVASAPELEGSFALADLGLGQTHLAYYETRNKNLVYMRQAGGAWQKFILDSSADAGANPSISFDSQGRPWILYRDVTNNSLKLARQY